MKVKVNTINNNTYRYYDISSVIERVSKTSGAKWLVLKKERKTVYADDVDTEYDFAKINLDQVEEIQFN